MIPMTLQGVLPMASDDDDGDSPTERNPHLDDVSVREDIALPTLNEMPQISPIRSISVAIEEKREHLEHVATEARQKNLRNWNSLTDI